MKEFSDIVSFYLLAKAEVGGQTYVCLRLLNRQVTEYAHGGSAQGQRTLGISFEASHPVPFGHVPTVSVRLDSALDLQENIDAGLMAVPKIKEFWGGLAPFPIEDIFADFTSRQGGLDTFGRTIRSVVMVINLGQFTGPELLPPIAVTKEFSHPRDSAFWVSMDQIKRSGETTDNGFSKFYLPGTHNLQCEVKILDAKKWRAAEVINLPLETCIGELLERIKGKEFPVQPRFGGSNLVVHGPAAG